MYALSVVVVDQNPVDDLFGFVQGNRRNINEPSLAFFNQSAHFFWTPRFERRGVLLLEFLLESRVGDFRFDAHARRNNLSDR